MGLAEILSNPGILGLAAAGLSRDPDAPMRAFGVLQGSNEMARQVQADEERKLQRADTLRMAQDMLGGQGQETNTLMNLLSRYQGIQQMPQTKTGFAPNNQTGAATDLETGQSYDTQVPNQDRLAETKQFYMDLQKINHPAEAAIDFNKYPNADPAVAVSLTANKFNMRKEMVKSLFDMQQEERKQAMGQERDMAKLDKEYALKEKLEETKGKIKEEGKETVPMMVSGKQVNVPVGQALNAELRRDMMAQTAAMHSSNQDLRRDLANRANDMRNRLPAGKVSELSEKMGTVSGYQDMVNSFDDKFAGSKMLGPTMTSVYERLGTEDKKGRVNWWKNFRWTDNVLRNEIFGASLTVNEKKEWDRTTVNENSDPAIVRQQLQQRLAIANKALGRMMDSYEDAGYNLKDMKRPNVPAGNPINAQAGQPTTPAAAAKPGTWADYKKRKLGQ